MNQRRIDMEKKVESVDVVDVNAFFGFEEKHLLQYQRHYEDFWKTHMPKIFGKNLSRYLNFVGFELIETALDYTQKIGRAAARSSDLRAVGRSLDENGWEMKHVPPIAFRFKDGRILVITGNSRGENLNDRGVDKMPVAMFESSELDNSFHLKEALIYMAQQTQEKNGNFVPATSHDIQKALRDLITLFSESSGDAGVDPHNIVAYEAAVKSLWDGATEQQVARVVQKVWNDHNPHNVIISYKREEGLAKLEEFNFNTDPCDISGVIYIMFGWETSQRGFTSAYELAMENPEMEIRIVINPGTLNPSKSSTFEHEYEKRIKQFVSEFDRHKSAQIFVSSQNLEKDAKLQVKINHQRVYVYAALPSIGKEHDLSRPVFFHNKGQYFYQRDNGYQVWMSHEDEFENTEYDMAA